MAKSSRPIITIHNMETNEITDREMNDAEFNIWQEEQIAKTNEEIQNQARAVARQTILDRLGLSEEEAKLLLG